MRIEQQDDTYQGQVDALFRNTFDELNFVKENINHRVPTELKTTNFHNEPSQLKNQSKIIH